MKIVCVGDCGVDLYLPEGERRFGGITANFARHARQQFAPDDDVHVLSCVGDDDNARIVLQEIETSPIEWHVVQLHGRTPVQSIEIEPDGEKNFTHYDEGVLADFEFDDVAIELIGAADLLVAPVYLQIVGLFDELLRHETKGLVAIDFADFLEHPDLELLERHLARIDIGFFGLMSEHQDLIDRLAAIASDNDKTFVVTLGADGSVTFAGGTVARVAAVPVNHVVDTTGAGDAYAAAFLSRFVAGGNIEAAMRHGASVASRVVGQVGSIG